MPSGQNGPAAGYYPLNVWWLCCSQFQRSQTAETSNGFYFWKVALTEDIWLMKLKRNEKVIEPTRSEEAGLPKKPP